MKCPVDNAVLSISDKNGIEIDYCPTCRGVWLDRGELDKLIERSASYPPAPAAPQQSHPDRDYRERDYDDDDYGYKQGYHGKKKRESFLGDLFDF